MAELCCLYHWPIKTLATASLPEYIATHSPKTDYLAPFTTRQSSVGKLQEAGDTGQEALFEELFKAAAVGEEGSKQFQDAMNVLMGQEPDLAQQIQRLAQAAGNAGGVSVCVCMCTGGVECSHGSGARPGSTDTEAGTGCWQCRWCVCLCVYVYRWG